MQYILSQKNIITLLILLFSLTSLSQSVQRSAIVSIGSTLSNNETKLKQSVGQSSVHEKLNNESVLLRQGFQQPLNTKFLEDSKQIDFVIFPNPNAGTFTVSIRSSRHNLYQFKLISVNGVVIQEGKVEQSIKQFNVMNKVNSGTYFFQIYTSDGLSSQHKLVII